jgi:prepilin-type N-terminal cleavage/methylation domain-containing protein
MRNSRAIYGQKARQGFSLLELLLAIVLVLMITGAFVFNFSSLAQGSQLEEGTARLETLMRFARAQAAHSGRKVQLVFGSESTNAIDSPVGDVRATWEPDPLGRPGDFHDMAEASWHTQEVNNLVQVETVQLLGSHTRPGAPVADDFSDDTNSTPVAKPPPITFYPDGSSDSAEIIIASRTREEEQRMAVRIAGITGSITHQLLSAGSDDPSYIDEAPPRFQDRWPGYLGVKESKLIRPSGAEQTGPRAITNSFRSLREVQRIPAQSNSVERVP